MELPPVVHSSACRDEGSRRESTLNLLDDSDSLFVASVFFEFEVLAKPTHFRNKDDVPFYRAYFEASVQESAQDIQAARTEPRAVGLGAMDTLHSAAARIHAMTNS